MTLPFTAAFLYLSPRRRPPPLSLIRPACTTAEEKLEEAHTVQERVGGLRASVGQKDTALKVTKAKLASVARELEEFKAAANHWQQDAERKIRSGMQKHQVRATSTCKVASM